MNLQDVMKYNDWVVCGDTENPLKAACDIKIKLRQNNYNVTCMKTDFEEVEALTNIDVLDLCINPIKGLEIIKRLNGKYKVCLIQPGAESEDILNFLIENNITYLQGCALVGMSLFKR